MKVKCLGLAAVERCMWRQRSRFLFLREGDCNSKFFHVKASARRRKSFIPSITVGDSTTVDQECKKQAIWKHFNDIFGTYKPCVSSINFSSLPFPEVQLESLSAPILADEVRAAVLEMHPEKAPGPDGFTGLFYRVAWDIIVSDLMKAIRLLENGGQQGLNLLNGALLVLLPKTSEAAKPYKPNP
jgi:mannosylglycoprotein endo-beta-mannosidase